VNPKTNPFAPGAGTRPPELAGREAILESAELALERVRSGRAAKSQMLLGLRGVGKTVLLNRIDEMAAELNYLTVFIEAPEGRRLAEMLVPHFRTLLFKLSRLERTKDLARKGLGILRSFANAFKVSVGDIEFTVDVEAGTADSGNLEVDLPEVLMVVATAAKAADKAVAVIIDEVQYLSEKDLSALIVSTHKMGQKGLPFILFGAGLPQLAALAGEAKSYAERLFDYPEVGALTEDAARAALRTPVEREGAAIADDALALIITKTKGYPYFLQEWGSHAWNVASKTPISADDAERATTTALTQLDRGFFRVRLDRLTPRERDYVRAMAQLGPGPHRSGEIANVLEIDVTTAGPLRSGLIRKGMIYSPQHGDTAFTVPMFDEFMQRAMPDWSPSEITARKAKAKKR
jgi:hypothetical protein